MKKRIIALLCAAVLLCGCSMINIVDSSEPKFEEITIDAACYEDKFYFQQLDSDEQLVYKELHQGLLSHKEKITVHDLTGETAGEMLQCVVYDFPEIFWADGSSSLEIYEGSHTVVSPVYAHSLSERNSMQVEIEQAAEAILKQVPDNNSDYEKIKAIYEILVSQIVYVEGAANNQNIYSSLVAKESVCAGYAKANQYLLGKLGIQCIYVVGIASGESHAWNIVECNETMYCVDVTWGDPLFAGEGSEGEILYDFLCCSKESLKDTHQEEEKFQYPSCEANDLEYYRLNQMFYETANKTELLDAMRESIDNKEECTVFKFADVDTYKTGVELIEGSLIEKAAQYLMKEYNLQSVDCVSSKMDDFNRIVIYWSY